MPAHCLFTGSSHIIPQTASDAVLHGADRQMYIQDHANGLCKHIEPVKINTFSCLTMAPLEKTRHCHHKFFYSLVLSLSMAAVCA